jgi:hypothetical protein
MADPTEAADFSTPPQSERQARWRRILNIRVSVARMAITLVFLALTGPALMALLAFMALPGKSWWSYFVEGVGSGWMAPALILAFYLIAQSRSSFGEWRKDRAAAREHTLAISMFASRMRYYQRLNLRDPMTAATFDVATYLAGLAPVNTSRAWEADAVDWYSTTAAVHELPPPPKSALKTPGAPEKGRGADSTTT